MLTRTKKFFGIKASSEKDMTNVSTIDEPVDEVANPDAIAKVKTEAEEVVDEMKASLAKCNDQKDMMKIFSKLWPLVTQIKVIRNSL